MLTYRIHVIGAALALGGALATGCSGSHMNEGDPLADIDGVRSWANRASAVGVWSRVHDIVAAGDARDPFRDPECPVIEDLGGTIEVRGGCTANDDRIWVGSATITDLGGGDEDIVIDGFGNSEDPALVGRLSGDVTIRSLPDGSHAFTLDLVNDAPFEGVMRIDYEGVVQGSYREPTIWNGEGTVELEGVSVHASTEDQLWDTTACNGAPASGQTTLTSERHVAEVIYDGAEDCDEEKNALWRLDGADMGVVDGITCAVSRPGAPGSIAPLLLVLAGLALRARRRR